MLFSKPASSPASGRFVCGPRVALGIAVGAVLVWAVPARAQVGGAPQAPAQPASDPGPGREIPAGPGRETPAGPGSETPAGPGNEAAPKATILDTVGDELPSESVDDASWNRGVDAAQRQTARALFRKANELARKRFFASAAAKYKQALALWPHPAFAYNLAVAQLHLDQVVEAHGNLDRALRYGPGPLSGRYQRARQEIARIESELSHITVTCAESGAHVMLDGKLLFTAPGEYQGVMRPGGHQLVATRRGLAPVVEQIVAAPGGRNQVALRFEYPEVEVKVTTRRWAMWKTFPLIGAGATLLVTGGVFHWHAAQLFADHDRGFRNMCATGVACEVPAALAEQRRRGESEQRVALIAYAVGGTALVTGTTLAYLGRERSYYKRVRVAPESEPAAGSGHRREERRPVARTVLVPLVSPSIIGVSVAFGF